MYAACTPAVCRIMWQSTAGLMRWICDTICCMANVCTEIPFLFTCLPITVAVCNKSRGNVSSDVPDEIMN
jgi:hypothetical protein